MSIDQAINLRDPSANVSIHNSPFVPGIIGDSTNVISFLGDKDWYVLLENTGDLTVSSFTWTAIVFRESNSVGPLFNWWSDWPVCGYSSIMLPLTSSSKLRIGVCDGSSNTMHWASNDVQLSLNQWHEVAVSYDGCNQIHILVDQDAGSEFLSWITGNMYAGTTVINDKWLVINSLNGQA